MQIGPGTRAFVTGASRGIGRALAETLAERGVVTGLAARSTGELEALAEALPGKHHVLECDVADRESVAGAVSGFVEGAGGIDLVVCNAGVAHYEPFADQPLESALQMSEVNWHGTLYTVHAALPHLIGQRRGHIVVISSGMGLRTFPSGAVYGGTKAAQRMFAEALRHELAGTGVGVTTVFPGQIATSLHDHERGTMPDWSKAGRPAPAHELARRIVAAVEADRRSLHWPPVIRVLGLLHNVSPRATDALLRRVRGDSAAPRRD